MLLFQFVRFISTREASGFEEVTRKLETARPVPQRSRVKKVDCVTLFRSFWADFCLNLLPLFFIQRINLGHLESMGLPKRKIGSSKWPAFSAKQAFRMWHFRSVSPQFPQLRTIYLFLMIKLEKFTE